MDIAKSEKTKMRLLESAKRLFMEKGYNHVTVREIASDAKVSHTTIYLYYKDKSELLNEIALQPLLEFQEIINTIYKDDDQQPRERIKEIGKQFIAFGIKNRTMYDVYFNQGSINVQEESPSLEVNKIRNHLFSQIMSAFELLHPTRAKELKIVYARMFYYFLNGLTSSYVNNAESMDAIMVRIQPTVENMLDILLLGIEHDGKGTNESQ
ncbi:TetR/AcrR family transcriptional regulator [Paenibacillus sp. TRM 82003]|nr:TetR/AcrR family transcriptional regulator [Paenibacillus sp. TRM 82003]